MLYGKRDLKIRAAISSRIMPECDNLIDAAEERIGRCLTVVADNQYADHQLRVNGWSSSVAVVLREMLVKFA